MSEIIAAATKKKISPLELVERIYDGKMPDIKPPIKRKVGDFALTIKTLRKAAKEVCSIDTRSNERRLDSVHSTRDPLI